jgi:CrcB protein
MVGLVAAGGALGAVARYLVNSLVAWLGWAGWTATLAVNLLGGLAMGALYAWLASRADPTAWRLLLATGVLGGFTTFSAFSLEVWQMLERREVGLALGYAAGSVVLAVGAVALGAVLARRWFGI